MTHDTAEITPSILYFGTPVVLITTRDEIGHDNVTPISSAWALDYRVFLGMAHAGKSYQNLLRTKQLVINVPSASEVNSVERIAPTTGCDPVPDYKIEMGYRFEADKFAIGGFTAIAAKHVNAVRVAECPLQLEARVLAIHNATEVEGEAPEVAVIETEVVCVHAHRNLIVPGTQRIDTQQWRPLFYVFRDYYSTGDKLHRNFRAEA
jgi:flavin reductase (DIM6/NTAB) family NADH-FMN oxidoreductase RutF